MITMIPRSQLEPHPDNPRKDLGDLTELAASIQRSGLLQNLTVVPHPDKPDMYRIIIGHRRFAASGTIGLDPLPCAIEDMSPADQVATMLAENMQRNDLTIADQVGGMQMMLDLGETVKAISDKTGLSETSVRKRVTIASLPKTEMKIAVDKGATIMDLLEVSKIADEARREEVLKSYGTNNWNYALTNAKNDELKAAFRAKILPMLDGIKPISNESNLYSGKYSRVCGWGWKDEREPVPPVLEEGRKYVYRDSGFVIDLYVYNPEYDKCKEAEKESKRRRDELKKEGIALNRQAFELRSMFVRQYRCISDADRKKLWSILHKAIMSQSTVYNKSALNTYHGWDSNAMRTMLALPLEEGRDNEETFIEEMKRRGVPNERGLLAWALCGGIVEARMDDGYCNGYDGAYRQDERTDAAYDILESVGYIMSDFETSLRNGTHEFFKR